MIDKLTFQLCDFNSNRNRKQLRETLNQETGCGAWYENFNTVYADWQQLIEKFSKVIHRQLCVCSGWILPRIYRSCVAGF